MKAQYQKILSWGIRIIPAVIMLQTLFFKFSGAPESVYIFSELGVEPWGRVGTGVAELVASIFLLFNPTIRYGALLGMAIMAGAIVSHIFILGVEIMNDKGLLFGYAIVVFSCCMVIWRTTKPQSTMA